MKHSKADKSKKEHASHDTHDANKTSAAIKSNDVIVEKKDKVFGITSLVCGLLSWVPLFNFLLSPLAIVFGILAIRRVRSDPQRFGGQGIAIAGLILGFIFLTFTIIYYVELYLALFHPNLVPGINGTLLNSTLLK